MPHETAVAMIAAIIIVIIMIIIMIIMIIILKLMKEIIIMKESYKSIASFPFRKGWVDWCFTEVKAISGQGSPVNK